MNRAVFLDRDNTIIHNDGDLADPDLVRLIQGSAIGIASMRGLGYRIVVVSNQPGVARGKFTEAEVDATNERIAAMTEKQANNAVIDRFYYCPFDPAGTVARYARDHEWRKPAAGMLRQAAEDMKLDLAGSWMVGDRLSDIEAGQAAGCRTILLADPNNPPTGDVTPDHIGRNLVEAARLIAQARPDPVPEHRRAQDAERAEAEADRHAQRDQAAERQHDAERQRQRQRERDQEQEQDRQRARGGDRETSQRETSWRGEAEDLPSPTATGTTYPATHPLESKHRPRRNAPQSQRPFKPWTIQHVTADARPHPPRTADADEPTDPAPEPAPAPVKEAERATSPHAGSGGSSAPDARRAPAESHASTRHRPTASAAMPETAENAEANTVTVTETETASRSSDDVPGLLRQILREVKQQHVLYGDWSMYNILGLAVLQPLAVLAALVGVFQAGDSPAQTLLWLVGAGFLQLTVLTALLLHGQR